LRKYLKIIMKIYLIAGEASGDANGASLIKALRVKNAAIQFRFWGGDKMQDAVGTKGKLVTHYREMAFMGVMAVLKNLFFIFKKIRFCKQDIATFHPDVVVLIDYGGFNLKIAKWAKQNGYKVVYYISPQIWASRESRVKKIKKYVDKMLCILPFEVEFYAKHGVKATYVGHPLMEAANTKLADLTQCFEQNGLSPKEFIALLPGSRKQEISKILPVMVSTTKQLVHYQFAVFMAPSIDQSFYEKFTQYHPNIKLIPHNCFELTQFAKAAIVTSGTATLEMALLEIPLAVCYKTEPVFYAIAKRIIKVPYISLVNILLNQMLVKEFIQNECNVNNLLKELTLLLNDEFQNNNLSQGYQKLKGILGCESASENAASEILRNEN
jgi:lipid-A-disaccharide synthase